MICTHTYLEIE